MPLRPETESIGGFLPEADLKRPTPESDGLGAAGKIAGGVALGAGMLFAPEITLPAMAIGGGASLFADSEGAAAAFRTENTIGSTLASKSYWFDGERDPSYDPWADIAGTPYEEYWDNFTTARSKPHADAIRADIDREVKDRRYLENQGAIGYAQGLAAGIFDPTILLPGGAIVRGAKGGASAIRTAGSVAAYGAGGAALTEGVLQATQQTRTWEESATAIAGATVLSGVLGAGLARRAGREIDAWGGALETDLGRPALTGGERASSSIAPSGATKPIVEAAPGASSRAQEVADAIRQTAEEMGLHKTPVRVQVVDTLGAPGDEGLYGLRAKRYAAPEIAAPDDIGGALRSIREAVEDARTAPLTGRYAPDDLQPRFIAYKKADTDLRAALIGGLSDEDALTRYRTLKAEAESVVNDLRKVDARINRDIERDMKGRGADDPLFSIRAFHGTPHQVDRFSMEKIGTGEGAQTFGSGLYFAENEAVAGHYRDVLGGKDISVDGAPIIQGRKTVGSTGNAVVDRALAMHDGDIGKAILAQQKLKRSAEEFGFAPPEKLKAFDDEIAELKAFKGKVETKTGGHLYEVDIDVEPHQLLDWDKPLSEREPAIRRALQKLLDEGRTQPGEWVDLGDGAFSLLPRGAQDNDISLGLVEALPDGRWSVQSDSLSGTFPSQQAAKDAVESYIRKGRETSEKHLSGKDIYQRLEERLGSPQAATDALREAGIPGLRFFDAGSRGGAGEGSRNIVVFDDSLIKITKKNGEAVTPAERKAAVDELFGVRQTDTGAIAEGRYDPRDRLITIAADALDPVKTLKHESIHALRDMKLLTDSDWKTLSTAAQKEGWLETNNVRQLYESVYKNRVTDDLLTEEAIAEQFSLWRQGAKEVKGPVAKIFQMMKDFLDRLGISLRTRGFQTADDVFQAVRSGEVAARSPASLAQEATRAAGTGAAASAGAAAVQGSDYRLKGALGLEKGLKRLSPALWLQNSPSRVSRQIIDELGETGTYRTDHADWYESARLGAEMGQYGSVESRVKTFQGQSLAEAFTAIDDGFWAYRSGSEKRRIGDITRTSLSDYFAGAGEKMDFKQFREAVGRAMAEGDAHEIPEVAAIAKKLRPIFDRYLKEAIKLGMLPEGVSPETAPSYVTRIYDRNRIIAERPEFKRVITDWLAEVERANARVRGNLSRHVAELDRIESRIEKNQVKLAKREARLKEFEKASEEVSRFNKFAYERATKRSEPIDALRQQIAAINDSIAGPIQRIAELTAEIRGQKETIPGLREVERQMQIVSRRSSEIKKGGGELINDVEDAAAISDGLEAFAEGIADVLSRLRAEGRQLRAESDVAEQLKALEKERAKLSKRISPLRKRLNTLRGEMGGLEKRARPRAAETGAYQSRFRARGNTLADQISGRKSDIESLRFSLENDNARVAELTKQVEEQVELYQGKTASEAQSAIAARRESAVAPKAAPQQKAAPLTAGDMQSVRAQGENAWMMSPEAMMEPDPYAGFKEAMRSLPDDIGDRFQVHGLSAGDRDANLLNLLDNGIDPAREFHSGNPKGGASGVDSTRVVAPYLILSDPGKSIRDTGVKHVVLNGPAEALRAKLAAAYPDVNFLNVREADAFMRTGAVPARPKAKAEPAKPQKMLKPVRAAAEKIAAQEGKDAAELPGLADQIIDRILGTPEGRLPYDGPTVQAKSGFGGVDMDARGPLAARQFMIPDRMIEQWLERDIDVIMRAYVHTMAPDIELTKRFGSPDMIDKFKEVSEEYARLQAQAKTPAERHRLSKQKDEDFRNIAAIRDRLRGTYAIPENPDAIMVRTARTALTLSYMSKLGGQVVSAFTDPARFVMVHGLAATFSDGLIPLFSNFKQFRGVAREMEKLHGAAELITDSRALRMADISDSWGANTKFERLVQSGGRNFGMVSLMAPWNATMKQFASILTLNRIMRNAVKRSEGKTLSRREQEFMAWSGISDGAARRMGVEFKANGVKQNGLWMPNTNAWSDASRNVVDALSVALRKNVDTIIITPTAGELPKFHSKLWGKLLLQFKSFSISATQKMLIAGLQQRDMAALNGALLSVALGGLVYYLKGEMAGKPAIVPKSIDDPNWGIFFGEAFDRSGLAGILMEGNNIVEKVSRGKLGLAALTGKPISRYASRNVTQSVLGPVYGIAEDVVDITGAAASQLPWGDRGKPQPWVQRNTHSVRQVIPWQNLVGIRTILDQVEAGINSFFGIPERAPAR